MRILIVSGNRVGGTRLGEWISRELEIPYIAEPYVEGRWVSSVKDIRESIENPQQSLIVKIFPNEFHKVIHREWDKIIGIVRENIEEGAQSMVWAEETNKWHKEYYITPKWLEKNHQKIEIEKSKIREHTNLILNNDRIECHITYEGIYQNRTHREKLEKYLGITPKFEWYLNPQFRYRKFTPLKLI